MKWALYDELIRRVTHDEATVRAARRAWESRTGAVDPDHDLYHERSDAFVEWFLLDRRDAQGLSAVDRELQRTAAQASSSPDEKAWQDLLQSLRSSQHSLYRVIRLRPGGLLLDDLLSGCRFDVEERRSLPGVLPGDLFEARLLPDLDAPYRLLLGRAVLFHPREAAAVVIQRATAVRESQALATTGDDSRHREFLEDLLRLRLKALTYRHVSPARIYGLSGEAIRRPPSAAAPL